MRTTLLDSQYKASLMGQTLQEFTAEAKAYDQSRLTQYALFVAAPMLLNYQIGSYNPSPSNASLNQSVRLDQIEIESRSGLKTYDYVPITPESLDRAKGLDKGADKAGADDVPSVNKSLSEDLTRAQNRNINKLDNIIENNLTEGDFSGTLADLQGNPIPKSNGGYWNHLTEMKQSYAGLKDIQSGLEGSLKNPTLSNELRTVLQDNLNTTNYYIDKIEQLFKPLGGIK